MKRWIVAALFSFGVLLAVPYTAWSASRPPSANLEMMILIPQRHHLAVFQQTTMDPGDSPGVTVDVLPDASHLRTMGGRIVKRHVSTLHMGTVRRRFSVRYRVPWDGRSLATSFRIQSHLRVLVVLVPPDLSLPSILNRVMAPVGEGRIPGVAKSPTFDEYAASNLNAGQVVPLVLEGHSPQTLGAVGSNSRLADVFLLVMGLMALAGIVAALQWNPSRRRVSVLLTRWALLDAAVRHGHITQGQAIQQQEHLWRQIKVSEDRWHDG